MRLTVTNRSSSTVVLPGPVSQPVERYETKVFDNVSLSAMETQADSWANLETKGYISWTVGEDPDVPNSLEAANLEATSPSYKSLVAPLTGVAAGTYYFGGGYESPAAAAALDETPTVATLGTALNPYAMKVFIVASAAGATDAGVVGVRVSGTSLTDAGVRTALDTEVLSADITTLVTDQYLESTKRWIGQVTVELYTVSGVPTVFSLTANYGFAGYDTMSDRSFTLDRLEATGLGGAVDAGFDIEVIKHEPRDWTYSLAAFAPGSTGMVLAQFSVDNAAEGTLAAGELFSWLRDLSEAIVGSEGEGLMIRVTTTAIGSVEQMQLQYSLSFT